MILIDNKEPPEVIEAFEKFGIEYKIVVLPVGDFSNEKATFIAERKGFMDFWNSMTDGRLYNQIRRMSEYHDRAYLFVETGSLADWAEEKKENSNWIYSLFGEAENWGIHFREYTDLKDLARKIYSLSKKLGTELKIRDKKPKLYNMTIAERMLSQVPGIGEKLTKSILKTAHSLYAVIEDVMNYEAEGVMSVDKMGPKKAENIKKALLEYHENL